jgi:hypothetical protein
MKVLFGLSKVLQGNKRNTMNVRVQGGFFAVGTAFVLSVVAGCGRDTQFAAAPFKPTQEEPKGSEVNAATTQNDDQSAGQTGSEDQIAKSKESAQNATNEGSNADSSKIGSSNSTLPQNGGKSAGVNPIVIQPFPKPGVNPPDVVIAPIPVTPPKPVVTPAPAVCEEDLAKIFGGYSVKGGKSVEVVTLESHEKKKYDVEFDSKSIKYSKGNYVADSKASAVSKVNGKVTMNGNSVCVAEFTTWILPDNTFAGDTDLTRGLQGQLYQIPSNTIGVPNFANLTPMGKVYASELDIAKRPFTEGFPGVSEELTEWFAIDFSGKIVISTPGDYQFRIVSDDGSLVYLNNDLLINNDGWHEAIAKESAIVSLSAGEKDLRIQYYQGPKYYIALELFYKGPGVNNWTLVPQSMLKTK